MKVRKIASMMTALLIAFAFIAVPAVAEDTSSTPVPVVRTMPNVVGSSERSAVLSLRKQGYDVRVNPPQHNDKVGKWRIYAQTPAAGTVMQPGQKVWVRESLGSEEKVVTASGSAGSRKAVFSVYGWGNEARQGVAWSEVRASLNEIHDHDDRDGEKRLHKYYYYFAHKTLPFGTIVRFEANGMAVEGICIDRGPYVGNREFDLGKPLARKLSVGGTGQIKVTVLGN